MVIDRCVCADIRFASLRDLARDKGARAIADLQEYVPVGKGCGLCRPYVRRMLETGQVVFTAILSDVEERPESD